VSDDWLDKFRDDRQKPKPASKPSGPGWLERFRDDSKPGAPRREGPAKGEPPARGIPRPQGQESRQEPRQAPRSESRRDASRDPDRDFNRGPANDPRNAPHVPPSSPPRGRAVPRNAPQGAAPKPQPAPRPSGASPQPQMPRGLWGRPRDILVFVSLMALSLALGLSATALALPRLMEIASPLEILLPDLLVIAVCGGFVYAVAGLRQSWAVWLLIVFCVVRFVLYVPTFFHIDSVTVRMLTAVYFILQAAAFWFVFTPAAKHWLRAARK
jgi:hypothetical protein